MYIIFFLKLSKDAWANSNAARCRFLAALVILPKLGWAIAHPAHPPYTPLQQNHRKVLSK
jgi:hypothetical protein